MGSCSTGCGDQGSYPDAQVGCGEICASQSCKNDCYSGCGGSACGGNCKGDCGRTGACSGGCISYCAGLATRCFLFKSNIECILIVDKLGDRNAKRHFENLSR